jgi:DnaK suppressor protein
MNLLTSESRKKLLARREVLQRLHADVVTSEQAIREVAEPDWPDRAQAAESSRVLERLGDREEQELEDIEAALVRIDRGTYGRCELCGGPIGHQRLGAIPEVRTCITCSALGAHA